MSTTAPAVSPAAPAFDWANPTPEQMDAAAAFIAERNARRVARDAYEAAKDAAARADRKAKNAAWSLEQAEADLARFGGSAYKGVVTRKSRQLAAARAAHAEIVATLPALQVAAEAEAQAEAEVVVEAPAEIAAVPTAPQASTTAQIRAAVQNETPAERAAAFTATAHRYAQQAATATFDYQRREYEAKAAKYLRFASWALEAEVTPAAKPVSAPTPATPAPLAQPVHVLKPRTESALAWRRLMATAKSAGLDTAATAREVMTYALSKYLGCIIPSRSVLTIGQLAEAQAGIEIGVLSW